MLKGQASCLMGMCPTPTRGWASRASPSVRYGPRVLPGQAHPGPATQPLPAGKRGPVETHKAAAEQPFIEGHRTTLGLCSQAPPRHSFCLGAVPQGGWQPGPDTHWACGAGARGWAVGPSPPQPPGPHMSRQHGLFSTGAASEGAVSFSRGGSPLAPQPLSGWGVSVSTGRPASAASGPSAGGLCSFAAARCRLSSARVWWALARTRASGEALSRALSW